MKRLAFTLSMIVPLLFSLGAQTVSAQIVVGQPVISQPTTVAWEQMQARDAQIPVLLKVPQRVVPFMPAPPDKQISGYPAILSAPAVGPAAQPLLSGPVSVDDQISAPTSVAGIMLLSTPGTPALGTSFQGLGDNNTTIPPDTMGAVGPNHVMTMLNSQVRIQDRTGAIISTVSLATFWASAGTESPFDPHLVYDTLSSRWIATCGADSGLATAKVFFAISSTNDPTGAWTFYSFVADGTGVTWADYPGFGVNSTWIAITNNMFTVSGNVFQGAKMWVIDKSTAMAGGALTTTVFATSFDGGGFTLKPAVTFDAAEPNLYIVDNGWSSSGGATDYFRLSRITGTAVTPVWSLALDAAGPFPGTGLADAIQRYNATQVNAAQSGSANLISSNDTRVMNAVFRNGHLWFTHTGGYPNEPSAATRTDMFWYEVDPLLLDTTGLPVVQSGSASASATANAGILFPTVAVNKFDDAAFGATIVDSSRFASAVTFGRKSTDPLGSTFSGPGGFNITTKAGLASYYKIFSGASNRWGDYSATMADPLNNGDFWTLQEYADAPVGTGVNKDRWGTWWAKVKVNAAPTASGVTITDTNGGSVVVGDSLTGSYTYADAESDAEGTSTFRWLRGGTAITGATASTYTLVAADSGTTIKFEVTPVAATGTSPGTAVASAGTTVINSAPTVSSVSVSGTATVGNTLTGAYTYADVDNDAEGTSTFRWLRGGTAITGATASTYTLVAADSGTTIKFEVTPVAATGTSPGTAVASAGTTVTAASSTSASGGGGGGCVINPSVSFDPIMLLMMMLPGIYGVSRRRKPN